MKKSMMIGLSLAIVSLSACVKAPVEDLPEAKIVLTAMTENPAETRTLVMETEGETTAKVYWEPGDSFTGFVGTQKGDFYAQISEPSDTAPFWGWFENGSWTPGMDLWAVYPFNWEASFEDGVITTVLPARQTARPGAFGRETNLSVAHTTSGTIQFYNVCGGVRFKVEEEGIREVILQGMDGEILSGKVKVGFQDELPAVLDVEEGKHAISLVPEYVYSSEGGYDRTFHKDVWYYFVALPGTLEKGFVLDFFKENEHGSRIFDKPVTVKRSIYGTLTHADEGVSYTPCADGAIIFKDQKVKSILASHFDVSGDGNISVHEAAIVRSFLVNKTRTRADEGKESIFAGTDITSFDELVYFTGLTRIEDGAFAGCEDLQSITIPETVTSIGDNAFNGCTGLQTILVLSPTPPAIGTDAFANSGDCPISVPENAVDQYVSAWNEYAPRIKAAEEPVCPTPEKVDLGLPSGTLWASFNLGASKPEEYGDYYAWGETKTKSVFSWSTYKWYKSEGGNWGLTKYCADSEYGFDGFKDDKWILDPEDDAAYVKLGEAWRMPTAGDWDELARLCTLEWVSLGGVDCAKLTGPNGNSIILPPGGGAAEASDFTEVGEIGVFWSSSAVNFDDEGAWGFGFYKDMDEDDTDFPYPGRCLLTTPYGERKSGVTIRPVYGPAPVLAESITLDKTEMNIKPGVTATLTATVLPGTVTHQVPLWVSDDERVATVSSTGEVTGVGVGETVIYAVLMDGLKMAQCTVMVGCPEAVDLGLPSGIRWASFNLGASYPYGDYYAWGETAPYYESGDAQSDSPRWGSSWSPYYGVEIDYGIAGYSWDSYKFSDYHWNYNEQIYEVNPGAVMKYNYDDGIAVLEPEDDAAHSLLGGEWRMPSWAEMEELKTACTWEWTTQDGINGYKVTGPSGNSIFFPAADARVGTSAIEDLGSWGYCWASSIYPGSSYYAMGLGFSESKVSVGGYARYYGFSIRPVRGTVPHPVESVSLNQSEISLLVGESATLQATVFPENATFTGTGWSYTYTSSGAGATISLQKGENGWIVTGLVEGTATVRATSMDGGKVGTCQVTVVDPELEKIRDLLGLYTATSTVGAYRENPWTIQLVSDAGDNHKVWFRNLYSNSYLTGDDAMFYGILDETVSTITIPYGQQAAYTYNDVPMSLYWLDADNNYGKTGSCSVTIVRDGAGKVTGLDFDENCGFFAYFEDLDGYLGFAYPHITAEKQSMSESSMSVKPAKTVAKQPSVPLLKGKAAPLRKIFRTTERRPEMVLLTGDSGQNLVDQGIERRGSGRGVVDHQGKDNRVLASPVRRRDVPAEAADPVHRSALHVHPFFKGGVRFGHAGD